MMNRRSLATTARSIGAVCALAALTGCETASVTAPPSTTVVPVRTLANIGPAAMVTICKNGPAGTYNFTVTEAGGRGGTLLLGSAFTVDAGTCANVWQALPNPPSIDTLVTVTVAEVNLPAGTQLDSIIPEAPITPTVTPTSVALQVNYYHGASATFYNSLVPPPPPVCDATSLISSNFNGTAIPGGYAVWFNAIVNVQGRNGQAATIDFGSSTITFQSRTLTVPNAEITFSSSATTATSSWDGSKWVTTIPVGYAGNVFLSGLGYVVPSGGLPGGINPVVWSGTFASLTTPGLTFQWKWAAAVYKTFGDAGSLGVKPIDATSGSLYLNSDHAGTPENFKAYVTGGARGGGGSNWTGSYSGTASAACQ